MTNYVTFTGAGNKICTDLTGARDYCPPGAYAPVPPRLFHNDGGKHLTDVTESAGISRAYGAGLGVAIGDLNGDGWPDIYVANDATPNQLWINKHDGTFEDTGVLSGTAFNALGRPEGSMGIALGDADGDGDEDLFITNVAGESHVLYLNDGRGNFEDARTRSGVGPATAALTGFGTNWVDYDNDGRLDVFIASGAVNIIESERGQPNPYRMHNQLLHNQGEGRFVDVSALAGPEFSRLDVARGAAFGDLDNDGDMDIVVTNINAAARVLLNQQIAPGGGAGASHWLEVSLRSSAGNRFGIGARLGLVRAGLPTIWRRARTDGSYLSANDARVHFGLGADARIDSLIVQWPDGSSESFTGVAPDRIVTLTRGQGRQEARDGR